MNYDKIKQIFASSDERLVAILGNNVAQTFFANGRIKEGFAILSNRRLYFKGTCLLRQGNRFSKIHEERTVDVENITGTGFVHRDPVWLKVLAFIFAGLSTFCLIGALVDDYNSTTYFLVCLGFGLLFLLFLLIYKSQKYTVFEVAFAGGGIGLDASWIEANEAQFFQKNIKLVGDSIKSQQQMYGKATSEAAELERYATLLEKGLISREEFEEQKRRLLH